MEKSKKEDIWKIKENRKKNEMIFVLITQHSDDNQKVKYIFKFPTHTTYFTKIQFSGILYTSMDIVELFNIL